MRLGKLNHLIAILLAPLAVWVLINGLDDFVIDLAAVVSRFKTRFSRNPNERVPTEATSTPPLPA